MNITVISVVHGVKVSKLHGMKISVVHGIKTSVVHGMKIDCEGHSVSFRLNVHESEYCQWAHTNDKLHFIASHNIPQLDVIGGIL